MIGDRAEAQLDPECRIDLGRDNRAAQRVAAEVEEIVVPADIRQLKNLRPDIGKQHLRFRSRLITLVAVANRKEILAERLSIDLVTLVVGETIQKHDSRRHHVEGQICSHGMSQAWRRQRRIALLDDKCDQHRLVIFARDSNNSGAIDAGKSL